MDEVIYDFRIHEFEQPLARFNQSHGNVERAADCCVFEPDYACPNDCKTA